MTGTIGYAIDYLQFQYGEYYGPRHGGDGGTKAPVCRIPVGDVIKEVGLAADKEFIYRLELKSKAGIVCGPYGRNGKNFVVAKITKKLSYDDYHLSHISGFNWFLGSARVVNALTFHWVKD